MGEGRGDAMAVDIDQRIGINSTSETGQAVVGDAAGVERGRRVEMRRAGLYEGNDDAGLDRTVSAGRRTRTRLAGVYDGGKARRLPATASQGTGGEGARRSGRGEGGPGRKMR